MALGTGYDRNLFVELDPTGAIDLTGDGILDETIGDHVGNYRGLNVVNPQPGFEYIWMLDPERGSSTNRMADWMAIRTSGGEVVKKTDPESAAFAHLVGDADFAGRDVVSNGEVLLVRLPVEEIARRRTEQAARARADLIGGDERFLSGASAQEIEAGQGEATRFRSRRHQLQFQEGGQTVNIHTPDSGIVRVDTHDPFTG